MTHHIRKIPPEYFKHVITGAKRFEIRRAREGEPYAVGDTLTLREMGPSVREFRGVITYVTDYDQKPGVYVLGFGESPEQITTGWYD